MHFSDFSFKKKIFLLLVLPVLGFLWLSTLSIGKSVYLNQEMSALTHLTKLSVIYSELAHQLQKERGITAGYLSSQGDEFSMELTEQRIETEQALVKFSEYWQRYQFEYKQISELDSIHDDIVQHLNEMKNTRLNVDRFAINTAKAIAYYSQLIAELLEVSRITAGVSSDARLSEEIIAYYYFLQAKERAGIERAVLSSTFAKGEYLAGMRMKFITLVVEQNTYLSNFNELTSEENRSYLRAGLQHSSNAEVLKIRAVALAKTSQFNIDSKYWFQQATARIEQLKLIENKLSDNLLRLAEHNISEAFQSLLFYVLFSLTLIVVVFILSFKIIKALMLTVKDLTGVMREVRHNNDLTVRTKYEGADELGQISSSLNATLKKFSEAITTITTSSLSLSTSAEETSVTCAYNSQSMLEQQQGVSLISTAIEELSLTIKEVASNTQETANSAKDVDKQAHAGLEVVKKSYQSIDNLAGEIDSLAKRISSLHESSTNITSVIDVIKSVAEQTNLLALNAAIEAARAGEQGRGFAVVADEVRTLAQRTQQSTAEIEDFILVLQSDANEANRVIEESQKKAMKAVDNSKDVEKILEEITREISNIFAMTEQVSVAIEQQVIVSAEVAQNVVTVEDKSIEAAAGASQISAITKEQAELAVSLQEIASTFKV